MIDMRSRTDGQGRRGLPLHDLFTQGEEGYVAAVGLGICVGLLVHGSTWCRCRVAGCRSGETGGTRRARHAGRGGVGGR
jgi:hypothetical protein